VTDFIFEEAQINSQIKNSRSLVVNPNTTVLEAIAEMRQTDSGYVLVMASGGIDERSDLLGILTREDIVRISLKGQSFDQLLVKDEMFSPVITIQESELTDMKSALVLFYSYQISRLPVLNGDHLVGVLTQSSLIELLAEKVLESKSIRYKISPKSLNLQDIQVQDESCLSLLIDTNEELQLHIEELKTTEEELRLRNIDLENIQHKCQYLFDFAPDGYLVTDHLGVVLSANLAICNFLSVLQEQLCGKPLVMYVEPSDQSLFHKKIRRDFSNYGKSTWEMSLKRADDNYCPVEVSVSETCDLSGSLTTLRWLIRDISDRRQAQQALQELNQSLETKIEQRTNELWLVNKLQRTILDSTDYAIITTDLNGIIQVFNHGAEQMLGYSMGEIIGQVTPAIFCDAQELAELAVTLSAELGQNMPNGFAILTAKASLGIAYEKELTNIRKDGSHFPVLLSITALRNGESLQPLAGSKSLNFVFENHIGTCAIYHDSIRIKQVITNLVSNAIKFTDSGEVCVELKYAEPSSQVIDFPSGEVMESSNSSEEGQTSPFATSNILISVRDTGIGIEPEFQRTIFEQFRQVDQSSTRKHGGTGLGLAITEQLVLLMGGTIYLESAVNQGSKLKMAPPFLVFKTLTGFAF